MSIDTKALPIWGWIAHHRESGGRPIIADPGMAAMLPRTEGWDVFPVCRVDDAADRIAALEAENSRLQAGIQLYKADFEYGLNGLKHEYAKLKQDNARLRNGNTALIGALMDMVHQHFYHHHDGSLHHSFMSADEGAIEVLIDAGYAEEAPGGGYRLLWDKLAERKSALAAGGDQ